MMKSALAEPRETRTGAAQVLLVVDAQACWRRKMAGEQEVTDAPGVEWSGVHFDHGILARAPPALFLRAQGDRSRLSSRINNTMVLSQLLDEGKFPGVLYSTRVDELTPFHCLCPSTSENSI